MFYKYLFIIMVKIAFIDMRHFNHYLKREYPIE